MLEKETVYENKIIKKMKKNYKENELNKNQELKNIILKLMVVNFMKEYIWYIGRRRIHYYVNNVCIVFTHFQIYI